MTRYSPLAMIRNQSTHNCSYDVQGLNSDVWLIWMETVDGRLYTQCEPHICPGRLVRRAQMMGPGVVKQSARLKVRDDQENSCRTFDPRCP